MNQPPDREKLLDEMLADEAGFRQLMLGETLLQVRRRRHWRQARRATFVLVAVSIAAAVVKDNWRPAPNHAQPTMSIALTAPAVPAPLVTIATTQPLRPQQVVTTASTSDTVREINDDQLLALVGNRPAVLMHVGQDTARLVFVHPEDEKGFPVN